jgi:hypothetical protein
MSVFVACFSFLLILISLNKYFNSSEQDIKHANNYFYQEQNGLYFKLH